MTDERGRPLTYWGGKPDEPHAGTVSLPWEKRVIESGTLIPNEPSTEQVPSGLTEGEHLSPQPVPTAGSTAWSEPKQASPNGPVYRTGTSTGIEGPTPRTDRETYTIKPNDVGFKAISPSLGKILESEIDRLRAELTEEHLLVKQLQDALNMSSQGRYDGALRLGIERNNEANELRAAMKIQDDANASLTWKNDELRAVLAAERQLRKTTIDRNVAAHAETAAAERQLADLRDQIISITESVPIPAPPGSASMIYQNDYFAGATAYRHALREAIFAVLRG